MVQDKKGRWWVIGNETGQWYVHDKGSWVRDRPPSSHLWLGIGAGILGVVLVVVTVRFIVLLVSTLIRPSILRAQQ
jgi:hypothetical protein